MSGHTDKPVTDMTDLEMLEWAQRRIAPLIDACPDSDARGNAQFALGTLIGTLLRHLRGSVRPGPGNRT